MVMKKTTLRSQISLAIAVSLFILAIGFSFVFIQFENKRREIVKQKIVVLLNAIAQMKKNDFANEILMNHNESIKILMDEMLKIDGIVNISIIKPDGGQITSNDTFSEKDPLDIT
ncbi:MAG: hypothetical protein K8S18_07370, partial [Desulfobacula sp.]|nr:hypothetical protein [Desulfobacula sp.]